jgi:hypothetical protein
MNDDQRKEMLRIAIDVWKFQIGAFWTRTSYFALFELAFAAGVWKIFDARHWITSAGMSVGALIVTGIWIVNNSRIHEYIVYYADRMKHYEATMPEEDTIFSRFEKNRHKTIAGQYHLYIQTVPVIFALGWIYMIVWSVCQLHCWLSLH